MHKDTVRKRLKRLNMIARIGVISFGVFLFSSILTGFFIHHEIFATYTENHQALLDAGFVDLIHAPEVVSQRILVLLSIIPALGVCLVLPLLFAAACQIKILTEETLSDEDE